MLLQPVPSVEHASIFQRATGVGSATRDCLCGVRGRPHTNKVYIMNIALQHCLMAADGSEKPWHSQWDLSTVFEGLGAVEEVETLMKDLL